MSLALPISVIGRQRSSKLLFASSLKLGEPVRIGCKRRVERRARQAEVAQFLAHAIGALTTAGMIGHEVLEIATVVEEFLGTQPIHELDDHRYVVSLAEQLRAQLFGGMIAPREGV